MTFASERIYFGIRPLWKTNLFAAAVVVVVVAFVDACVTVIATFVASTAATFVADISVSVAATVVVATSATVVDDIFIAVLATITGAAVVASTAATFVVVVIPAFVVAANVDVRFVVHVIAIAAPVVLVSAVEDVASAAVAAVAAVVYNYGVPTSRPFNITSSAHRCLAFCLLFSVGSEWDDTF